MAKLFDVLEQRAKKKQIEHKSFSVKLEKDKYDILEQLSKVTELSKAEIVEMALNDAGVFDKKRLKRILEQTNSFDLKEKNDKIIQGNNSSQDNQNL